MIEEEVGGLQRQKRRKSKRGSHKGSRGAKSGNRDARGMPKLDLHDEDTEDGYASGFQSQSDFSAREPGDVMSSTPTANVVAVPHQAIDTISTDPIPFTGSSEVAEESQKVVEGTSNEKKPVQEIPEENRPLLEGEKIHGSVQESLPYQRSISGNSVPVFPSQVDVLESIQHLAECEKNKRKVLIAEKDKKIYLLQQQIQVMQKEKSDEKKRYEEEIEKKREDLEQCEREIVQKKREIHSL